MFIWAPPPPRKGKPAGPNFLPEFRKACFFMCGLVRAIMRRYPAACLVQITAVLWCHKRITGVIQEGNRVK